MTTFRRRLSISIPWLAACLALAACEQKELPELPPPTGENAPPPPKIPSLAELGQTADGAESNPGARAGTGSLQALHFAALGPKVSGVLSAILVREGDRVRKGQVLFRLDTAQAELAVQQAKAALTNAQIQQSSARLDLERTQSLRERGSVPQDALDQATTRAEATSSMVAQAQVALDIAQRHLADMVVTSPIDGIVAEKRMNVGEMATMMPPSIVVVVQDIDTLELRARLPETALKTVRQGGKVDVRFPATGEERSVTIERISPTVDPRTRTIELVARIENPDHRLKAGMLAEVAYTAADAAQQSGATDEPAAEDGDRKAAERKPKKSAAPVARSEADRAAR